MISLIVAMGKNRAIGLNNKMPWHLPADLKYFKKVTTGHTIVMGRKTFESIGRPLPNRTNVILTRDTSFVAEGCQIIHTVDEAVQLGEKEDIFVIGGAELYHQLLPYADLLYVTQIHESFEADTFFPEIGEEWKLTSTEKNSLDENNSYDYEFQVFVRR